MMSLTMILRTNEDRQYAIERLRACPLDPHHELVLRPYKRNRSGEQNRYYWVILGHISISLGSSKDELHEEYKRRFLVPILLRDDEQFRELVGAIKAVPSYGNIARKVIGLLSTTSLNVGQMSEYIDEVIAHAATLGIALPTQEDVR